MAPKRGDKEMAKADALQPADLLEKEPIIVKLSHVPAKCVTWVS